MRTIAKVCYYAVLLAALGGAKAVRETPWRRLDEPAQPPPAPVACGAPAICATLWERRDEAAVGTWPRRTAPDQRRAIGSAGERLVHTEEVTGSIPVSPTRSEAMRASVKMTVGAIPVAKWSASRYAAGHGSRPRMAIHCPVRAFLSISRFRSVAG